MDRLMIRRLLLGFGIMLAVLGVPFVIIGPGLVYGLTHADPYPPFMADYQSMNLRTYRKAERAFNEFVAKTFPIGSNAKDAIATITREGFQVVPARIQRSWKVSGVDGAITIECFQC